jgi:hypothetical protein
MVLNHKVIYTPGLFVFSVEHPGHLEREKNKNFFLKNDRADLKPRNGNKKRTS